MTNEELVEKVKNGDSWATLELWKSVERFVKKKARLYLNYVSYTKVEYEDLVQAGFLAMTEAAEEYDPDRGCSFLSFLVFFLQKHFAEECGYRSSKRDVLMLAESIDEPIKADDPTSGTLEDLLEDPGGEYAFCFVEYIEFLFYVRNLIYAALHSLSPRQCECIEKCYLMGMSLEEAAGGRSKQCADLAIKNGFRILRRGKYRRQLWEALKGFEDFEELRAEGRRNIELKSISKDR